MLIEDEIFKNWQIDYNKIIAYGFIKVNDSYCYSKNIIKVMLKVIYMI